MTKHDVFTNVSAPIAAWTTFNFTFQTLAADFVPVENKICSAQVEIIKEIIEAPVSPCLLQREPWLFLSSFFFQFKVCTNSIVSSMGVSNKVSLKTLLSLLMKRSLFGFARTLFFLFFLSHSRMSPSNITSHPILRLFLFVLLLFFFGDV